MIQIGAWNDWSLSWIWKLGVFFFRYFTSLTSCTCHTMCSWFCTVPHSGSGPSDHYSCTSWRGYIDFFRSLLAMVIATSSMQMSCLLGKTSILLLGKFLIGYYCIPWLQDLILLCRWKWLIVTREYLGTGNCKLRMSTCLNTIYRKYCFLFYLR